MLGALQNELTLGGMGVADNERAEQQRAEYKKRGITLVAYEAGTNTYPYFTNLDEDAFRSNRFMYLFQKVFKQMILFFDPLSLFPQ